MPVIFSVARKAASIGPSPSVTSAVCSSPPRRSVSLAVGFLPLPLATSNETSYHSVCPAPLVNLLLDQGDDVAVVDLLLLVGQLLELVEHRLQLLAGQVVAQGLGPVGERGPAAVLAQHQVGLA